MSGDVQPRKRKDKKRKKDELGVEEPRGTAAVLGEGDVFMHSQHEHGTGGHWCAKIIFFSLLAVLVTLIGLIILENRGLTELEANSVESRYSGVLDGWLEDAPDDDHHDEHTLELLKNHDDEDNQDQGHDISEEDQDETEDHDENQSDQDENDDEEDNDDDDDDVKDHDSNDQEASDEDEQDDNDDDDEHDNEEDDEEQNENGEQNIYNKNQDDSNENSEEQQLDADEADDDDDDEEPPFDNDDSGEDNEDDDLQKVDEVDSEEDNDQSNEVADESVEKDDDINSREDEDDDEEHEENGEEETDSAIELEKLEKEVSDEDISEEQPTQEAEEDDKSQEVSSELPPEDNVYDADVDNLEDEEYLEPDIDEPLPVIERIVAPKGKPLPEVEDETTTTKPADTLADEEEYEKQQEELRREQAQASHVWLKLAVGGALLVATHAVVSRAVAPRDETPASDGHAIREDTPLIDRRMTLVPEEPPVNEIQSEVIEEIERPVIDFKKSSQNQPVTPPSKEESEEEIEEEEEEIIDRKDITRSAPVEHVEKRDKELFSEDEDEAEEEEEVIIEQKKVTPEQAPTNIEKAVESEPEEVEIEEDVPDDVEIIDDEHLEEELEEEEDEEEISDVDDAELLTRLEAKYGRLPEPERGHKHKDGGNSVEDDWPGEPSDKYWRQQLDEAEQELRQGAWSAAMTRAAAAQLRGSARARWILARAVDAQAEAQRDNRLLSRAIAAYLDVLKLNERLTDDRLRHIASRTLDRIRFRGNYLSAEPIYRLLIRRFPDVVDYRNNLTVTFLMANRADLAEQVIKETLKTWPNDRVALAHMGFILKTQHNRLEEAVEALQKALEGDVGPATESRFYYHLGDSLLLLNRFTEAHEVHKRGAKLGHFLSPAQRSLYNVNRLKSRPWWDIEQTPYVKLARALEKSWKEILKEGRAAQALYEKEKEGLKERGEWSQLDLFVRGQEVPGRCKQAPVTCSVVRAEKAAAGCRRGQVKFSAMEAGTHVRPHVGPTNCRLRMHLGLSNTKDTYIRVDKETRQWQVGKVFMFDDSFEHEVWHNGTGTRLVLIVDVWHPALSADERRDLPPI